jgi:hypothetical protein
VSPPTGGERAAPFTLHAVTEPARLRELGRTMHNCLASYGDRLRGEHRIVEVRQAGTVRYAIHVERGRIVTFEAPGNQRPDPADVPVVRRLLEDGGHLAATIRAERDARGTRPAPVPQGQLAFPAVDARPGRRASARRASDADPAGRTIPQGGSSDPGARPVASVRQTVAAGPREARTVRPARVARTARSGAGVEVPGVSLQELATEYLGPTTLQSPDWTEVAAAMWAGGLLPRLPSPTQTAFERVVRDLASRVAIGEDRELPRRPPPTPEERIRAHHRLLEGGPADVGWQRRRMAAVLQFPVRP